MVLRAVSPPQDNFGVPGGRTFVLNTAYQATDTLRSALFVVTLDSTATLTLTGGTDNLAEIFVGPNAADVVSGSGTARWVGRYRNRNTGSLTIGLNLSTNACTPVPIYLPMGYYFSMNLTSGTVSVVVSVEYPLL